jgi:hypothetical protein
MIRIFIPKPRGNLYETIVGTHSRVNGTPRRTPQIDAARNCFYDAQHAVKRAPIPAPTPQHSFVSLLACFFVSGATELIYQVTWTKSLALYVHALSAEPPSAGLCGTVGQADRESDRPLRVGATILT